MKVSYKKKTVRKGSPHKKSMEFHNGKLKKPTLQSANRRTVVWVTAVPRRTLRGC